MKKLLFTIIIIFSINITTNAQAWDGKGDVKINGGLEFYGYFPNNNITQDGNGMVATIDYGILENISIGSGANYNFVSNNFYLNLRADYHFQTLLELSSNFDIYAGADGGLNSTFDKQWDFGLHGGMRFMFTDAIGIYVEIGNRGNAGLSYNF